MIAALAVYAAVLGLVVGVFAVLFERGVRALQGPTRFVWAAAMVAMVLLPATALVPRAPSTPEAQSVATLDAVPASKDAANEIPTMDDGAIAASPASVSLADRLQKRLDRIRDNTAPYDGVLLAIWAVASAFFLGVLLHAMSEARRMRTGLQSAVVGGTAVLVSEDIGPSAVGGNSAAIVMPRWAMALDESLRSLVIRHEQEHLSSRDPTLMTIVLCLLVLMPWHPVLWWSWRRLRLAIEIDCDARVLRFQPNPKVYGQLLLLVSHHRSRIPRGQRVMMSLAAPLSPQASQLKQRIDAMTTQPTRHKRSMVAALTMGMVGACILIAAVPAPRSNAAYSAGSSLEYRWVTRQGAADGVMVLPRRTEGDSSFVTVTEPFLTLDDVDSIIVIETDNGETVAAAKVHADVRNNLRATTRQRAGSEVAVVVDGIVIGVATVTTELGGPLPIWTGASDKASALAERLRKTKRERPVRRTGATASMGNPMDRGDRSMQGQRVTISITNVGTRNTAFDDRGQLAGEILIYGDGVVGVGLGTAEPRVLTDTIHLKTFPALNLDVTKGDVHIELRGGGELELSGTVAGGPAVSVGATGRHLVLKKGGVGIASVPQR